MPQAKTSKKKSTAKVGGGGVGTKKSKFNLKIMIPVVVLVAALGGFYIFRKSSAGIAVPVSSLGGAELVRKSDGYQYRLGNKDQHVYIIGGRTGPAIPSSTNLICARVRYINAGVIEFMAGSKEGEYWGRYTGSGYTTGHTEYGIAGEVKELCTKVGDKMKGQRFWANIRGYGDHKLSFGVSGIYFR